VPELAGLGSYADAARIGFSVDETVRRLLRYQWLERAVMRTAVSHLIATPEWEVKCGLALLQWLCAEHVEAIRTRIGEMRHPVPALDEAPDPALERFCAELLRPVGTIELLVGIYDVVVRDLVGCYREHLDRANILVDQPTRRVLRQALVELTEALEWGGAALEAMGRRAPDGAPIAANWRRHLREYLAGAGGVTGDEPVPVAPPPSPRAVGPFIPDLTPRRDDRFSGLYNFEFPPHVVYNDPAAPADERNLALLAKRTLEMDVPEMMASVMVEREDLPWEFHRDYARQLWDESRHAMLGTAAFEAKGVDWTRIPLNVGFALRLNRHATAIERQALLFAIEQSLMPGETGKRFEYRTAVAAGDELSAHYHDYDWADEVLHAQIGRRWLKREGIGPEEAQRLATQVHERTWAALDRYRGTEPQVDWWDGFVRQVLGRPSAVPPHQRASLSILAE
jgi:hypothetical protein